jgi:tetratricopeptide (TPR) repeat protein
MYSLSKSKSKMRKKSLMLENIAIYEQSMYQASALICEEILREFPDYTEVRKILAFSYFELGHYEDAKKSLLAYIEKNPNDLESIVRMGEIQSALSDYVASNLYLNNAIIA